MAIENLLHKLKASWTKYDSVRVINIIGNDELEDYLNEKEAIDPAILKAYLGLKELTDPIPTYWLNVIKDYPKHRKLFALLAGIFTHYVNIEDFAIRYSTVNMGGIFKIGDGGKHQTNLRSALVEAGVALTSFRRKSEVPYDFSELFTQENIGKLFKELLKERLFKIGHKELEVENNFYDLVYDYHFHKTISLNKSQFKNWLEGKAILPIKDFKYDLNEFRDRYEKICSLKVDQWLAAWNDVDYDLSLRSKPEPHFYLFKIDIRLLKRISDVHRRNTQKPRAEEINVQRALKEERSIEIRNYVQTGFPLSTLNEKDRGIQENQVLRMPGFLPTAILINILGPKQKRGNSTISDKDLITIQERNDGFEIILPPDVFTNSWNPELKPVEVIDGQHRLWAFDETEKIEGQFEVPVVAYFNLDRAWQAYLFYVINIKPKKINTSLGYDLYPLLRTQEWLENSRDGIKVYRETRAQELVEALWSYQESPWFRRISMLGEDGGNISQNAFIRALSDSYFKKSRKGTSGLFSDVLNKKNEELKWVRAQQAGFLILLWDEITKVLNNEHTKEGILEWVDKLRQENISLTSIEKDLRLDKSFVSKNSNLGRDQGVTGISMFSNDIFYVIANEGEFDFNEIVWDNDIDERQIEHSSIDLAIKKFNNHPIYTYIQAFAREVIKLDWRTSSAEFEDPTKSELQKKYRGSGGYREIWNDLLKVFLATDNDKIRHFAEHLNQAN